MVASLGVAQPRITAHELVRDTLRRAILSGTLSAGSRLVQADIASQLEVSTTPVREALRDLATEGLVVFRAHIGAVVRELNLDEVVQLYEMRKALDPVSIRRAATRITPEEVAEAQRLVKMMEEETDPAAWVELNSQFHAVLEAAAKAPLIQSLVKSVRDISAIYVAHSLIIRPSRIASGNREHRALLSAVRRHDPESAAELMVSHLNSTLELILESQSEIFLNPDAGKQAPKARH